MIGWRISRIIGYFVGWLYPAYMSFKAIETETKEDDTQWLIYWVAFTTYALVEEFADKIVSWIPFYFELKIVVLFWMAHPRTRGAEFLYAHFIKPYLTEKEEGIDALLGRFLNRIRRIIINLSKAILSVFRKQAVQTMGPTTGGIAMDMVEKATDNIIGTIIGNPDEEGDDREDEDDLGDVDSDESPLDREMANDYDYALHRSEHTHEE